MMKKIITIISVLFVFGNIIYSTGTDAKASDNTQVEYSKYEKSLESSKLVNYSDLSNQINQNKTEYLYVGHKECPYCRDFVNTLDNFIKNTKTNFEYLDLDNTSKEEIYSILKIVKNSNYNSELKLPIVVKIQNGKFEKILPGHEISYKDLNDLIN